MLFNIHLSVSCLSPTEIVQSSLRRPHRRFLHLKMAWFDADQTILRPANHQSRDSQGLHVSHAFVIRSRSNPAAPPCRSNPRRHQRHRANSAVPDRTESSLHGRNRETPRNPRRARHSSSHRRVRSRLLMRGKYFQPRRIHPWSRRTRIRPRRNPSPKQLDQEFHESKALRARAPRCYVWVLDSPLTNVFVFDRNPQHQVSAPLIFAAPLRAAERVPRSE